MNERQMIQEEEGWTRPVKGKKLNKLVPILASSTLAVMVVASGLGFAWADTSATTNGLNIKATDAIKNDPATMKVLQTLELFKQQWALQQQVQQLQDQQDQFIQQQRALANAYLQNDLARMNNAKDQTTPLNAYTNFVNTVNTPAQAVFEDEFTYMQQKVQQAENLRNQVLQNGGTADQAVQAFNNAAVFHKTDLVSENNNLNVRYNLADQKVQSLFNQWGSMPRN